MKTLWKASNTTLAGYPCAVLISGTGALCTVEYVLAGRRGEIWEVCPGTYAAIEFRGPGGGLYDSERRVRFGGAQLSTWVVRLEVPLEDPEKQAMYANTYARCV